MMDEAALRARVRRLVYASPALSRALLTGDFRSSFRGRGMDFDTLREYSVFDDAMRMDWNATARFARPYVKTYREDRGLSVYLVIDESASMHFGTGRTRWQTAVLAAALLAWAGAGSGVLVGALFFGSGRLDHYEPAAGDRPVRILVERMLAGAAGSSMAVASRAGTGLANTSLRHAESQPAGSNVGKAVTAAITHLKRRSLLMVLSDFRSVANGTAMALAARRHDMVALMIRDPLDDKPPALRLLIRALDAETAVPRLVAPASGSYRDGWAAEASANRLAWLSACAAGRIPVVELGPSSDPAQVLIGFFRRRRVVP
jgi:uncharacterized protein (DUF58 family)